jgi:hypothetical protein
MVSSIGKRTGSPNVAQVEEKTSASTPALRVASIREIAPPTLLSKNLPGFLTDSPTSMLAAKCRTATGLWAANTSSSRAPSRMSPISSGPHCTCSRWPLDRSSNTTGLKPSCARRQAGMRSDIAGAAGHQDSSHMF